MRCLPGFPPSRSHPRPSPFTSACLPDRRRDQARRSRNRFPTRDVPSPRPELEETGPLQVLRYAPEGKVETAAAVSITFSQPMIPVTSQTDAVAAPLPVTMEPAIEGSWRWLGTQTLVFDRLERFPLATRFTLTVPAGTQSESGGTLAESVSWSFETGRLKTQQIVPAPGQVLGLAPMFIVRFNGTISRAEAAQKVHLMVDGVKVSVRSIDRDELRRDSYQLGASVRGLNPARIPEWDGAFEKMLDGWLLGPHKLTDRWLAFRPTRDLKPNAQVALHLGPGLTFDRGQFAHGKSGGP